MSRLDVIVTVVLADGIRLLWRKAGARAYRGQNKASTSEETRKRHLNQWHPQPQLIKIFAESESSMRMLDVMISGNERQDEWLVDWN